MKYTIHLNLYQIQSEIDLKVKVKIFKNSFVNTF